MTGTSGSGPGKSTPQNPRAPIIILRSESSGLKQTIVRDRDLSSWESGLIGIKNRAMLLRIHSFLPDFPGKNLCRGLFFPVAST